MYGGKCYFVSPEKSSKFKEAKAKCRSIQADSQLVSITSSGLYQALIEFVESKITGLKMYQVWTSGIYDVSYHLFLEALHQVI